MKIITAIDSFKECITSAEANKAMASGLREVFADAEIIEIAMSDGGEGWLEAFESAISNYTSFQTSSVSTDTVDPLMRPIKTRYITVNDTAIILPSRIIVMPYSGDALTSYVSSIPTIPLSLYSTPSALNTASSALL